MLFQCTLQSEISTALVDEIPVLNGHPFAASNALHYVRQLISIVGRYGTLDKEFAALMDQLVAAYNKASPLCSSIAFRSPRRVVARNHGARVRGGPVRVALSA
jgi:hypothetical protein